MYEERVIVFVYSIVMKIRTHRHFNDVIFVEGDAQQNTNVDQALDRPPRLHNSIEKIYTKSQGT